MRPRSTTIGAVGRAPARQSKQPPNVAPPEPPPPPERPSLDKWIKGALFENLGLKFLSMVLAVTVFLLVNTDRDREISARVGVSYTLPEDRVLTSERIEEVRITIKGPWQRLRRFDERELDRINLDLRQVSGSEYAITPDMIRLPPGLSIGSISPRTIPVVWDRRVEKVVEITPSVVGRPQHGYEIKEAPKVLPATVRVRGAEGRLGLLPSVRTHDVTVEGRVDKLVQETEPLLPDGIELIGPQKVVVEVAIGEELVSRKLPGIPVTVRGVGCHGTTPCADVDASKWTVTPSQIEVTLTGELLEVEKAKSTLSAVVRLAPNETKSREIDVSIEGVKGLGVRISPERVKVAPVAKIP